MGRVGARLQALSGYKASFGGMDAFYAAKINESRHTSLHIITKIPFPLQKNVPVPGSETCFCLLAAHLVRTPLSGSLYFHTMQLLCQVNEQAPFMDEAPGSPYPFPHSLPPKDVYPHFKPPCQKACSEI